MAKKQVELKAKIRQEKGKKAKTIRAAGLIPAVVYGRKFGNAVISIDAKEFQKKVLQSDAGENLIFTLKISGNGKKDEIPVITYGIQRDALTDVVLHIDLMHVIMDELIKANISLELTGTPIGVKEEGGVLVHGLRDIEVECLPADIPEKFEINVATLAINHSLHVSDLKTSDKVKILSNLEEMIASVKPPTKEEEEPTGPTPEEVLAAEGEEGAVPVEGEEGAVPAKGEEKAPAEKGKPGAVPAAEKGKPEAAPKAPPKKEKRK